MAVDKKKRQDFFDDGRVIADMSIDGMPGSMFKRKPISQSCPKKDNKEAVKLTKDQRRGIMHGIAASYIIFGVVFFGLFALFILFCTEVWFK